MRLRATFLAITAALITPILQAEEHLYQLTGKHLEQEAVVLQQEIAIGLPEDPLTSYGVSIPLVPSEGLVRMRDMNGRERLVSADQVYDQGSITITPRRQMGIWITHVELESRRIHDLALDARGHQQVVHGLERTVRDMVLVDEKAVRLGAIDGVEYVITKMSSKEGASSADVKQGRRYEPAPARSYPAPLLNLIGPFNKKVPAGNSVQQESLF